MKYAAVPSNTGSSKRWRPIDSGRRAITALALSFLIALSLGVGEVRAAFPDGPIKLIVPFGPGGGTDIVARTVAQRVIELTGWNVVVENRPGAGGVIGAEAVAHAAPDGQVWLLGTVGTQATNEFLYKSLPYDPKQDFKAVALLGEFPNLFVVRPELGAKTLQEFITAARASPQGLTFSSSGNGSSSHLAGELLRSMTNTNLVHVPYKTAGQGHTDLLGGRVDFTIDNLPPIIEFVRAGKMIPIAVTSKARNALLPDVPTMEEAGLPGYEATAWFGLFVPAATPSAVVAAIQATIERTLKDPKLREQFGRMGISPGDRSGAAFDTFINQERVKWKGVIERAQIKPG